MRAELEEQLHDVFRRLADIPDTEWAHIRPQVREMRFDPGIHLFEEGKPVRDVHYIVRGLVRIYHNDDGRELVRGFDYEGRFITIYESVIRGTPSALSVQALEATHTLSFAGDLLLRLYERHPCWDRVGRRILEDLWLRRQDKEMRFRLYAPEEHYRLLIERKSPLVTRVPLRQLASYLQIAPETLSRIRARLRERGVTPAPLAADRPPLGS